MRLPWRYRKTPKPPLRTVYPVTPPPLPAEDGPAEIEAQARYHRDRLALYRARMHSARPTSTARLAELERVATAADERLRSARRTAGA
jgi:hypothetical protein